MVGLTKAPHHGGKQMAWIASVADDRALETRDHYAGLALRLLTTHQLATTLSAPPSFSLPAELLPAFLPDISGSPMH